MTKKTDSLETVILAIELLRRIPRKGKKVTASELHRQLVNVGIERDLRTIQRQLDALSKHFEIERDDRNKPYGYSWLEEAKALAVPTLTPQESLLLQLAEEHLKHLLPAPLMDAMEAFFTQARRNLGPDSNARLEREWRSKVRVVATTQPLLPPKIRPGVFETVSDALYTNHWLKLKYKNASGRSSDIEVMPLGLVQQGPRLYLVARYRGFDNERNLALHRITHAERSTIAFKRPTDFDLKRYDDDGRFGFGEGDRIRLRFCIEAEAGYHLYETRLSQDQQITPLANGRLMVECTVVDSAMLTWWLRGFGDAVSDISKIPL